MRKIGLIGGMSFESTVVYYQHINEKVHAALGALHSAEILMHSVEFQDVVDMQKAGRWDLAAAHHIAAAKGLIGAGAECVLICTNTMHLVADEVAAAIDVPLINIIDVTADALVKAGKRRPLLLATRYTMEEGFYAKRMTAHGLSLTTPTAKDRQRCHDIIFDELCAGIVRDDSRKELEAMVDAAKAEGADSVILGCTEICLILDPDKLALPGFDSTELHIDAAVAFALSEAKAAAAE